MLPVYTTLSTAVLSTSYALSTYYVYFCCTACTRRLEDNKIYCCTCHLVCSLLYFSLYATAPRYQSILLRTLYKPPILACCSNVPCFTANRERRRAAGQLAAQENARYKDSYLRAFDPARPLHLESWVQRSMQKGFADELQRLRPGRWQFLPRESPNRVHAFREAFQNRRYLYILAAVTRRSAP